jgi:hypothetical protein
MPRKRSVNIFAICRACNVPYLAEVDKIRRNGVDNMSCTFPHYAASKSGTRGLPQPEGEYVELMCISCGKDFTVNLLNDEVPKSGIVWCSLKCKDGKRATQEELFWYRVAVCEHGRECEDCCWLWMGAGSGRDNQYGNFSYWDGSKVKNRGAHIYSHELHIGPVPKGKHVCHTCDVPRCVQPKHLFKGSPRDNIIDASQKGRLSHGETHHHAKLSTEQVIELRQLRAEDWTYQSLADKYNINVNTARRIALKLKRRLG